MLQTTTVGGTSSCGGKKTSWRATHRRRGRTRRPDRMMHSRLRKADIRGSELARCSTHVFRLRWEPCSSKTMRAFQPWKPWNSRGKCAIIRGKRTLISQVSSSTADAKVASLISRGGVSGVVCFSAPERQSSRLPLCEWMHRVASITQTAEMITTLPLEMDALYTQLVPGCPRGRKMVNAPAHLCNVPVTKYPLPRPGSHARSRLVPPAQHRRHPGRSA